MNVNVVILIYRLLTAWQWHILDEPPLRFLS